MLDLHWVLLSFYCPDENRVYQQIVWIFIGTHCAHLIVDLLLFCNEMDFMSNLHTCKKLDIVVLFDNTSWYLDELTIDNPEFEKHISDICPAELQLNKANSCQK